MPLSPPPRQSSAPSTACRAAACNPHHTHTALPLARKNNARRHPAPSLPPSDLARPLPDCYALSVRPYISPPALSRRRYLRFAALAPTPASSLCVRLLLPLSPAPPALCSHPHLFAPPPLIPSRSPAYRVAHSSPPLPGHPLAPVLKLLNAPAPHAPYLALPLPALAASSQTAVSLLGTHTARTHRNSDCLWLAHTCCACITAGPGRAL